MSINLITNSTLCLFKSCLGLSNKILFKIEFYLICLLNLLHFFILAYVSFWVKVAYKMTIVLGGSLLFLNMAFLLL